MPAIDRITALEHSISRERLHRYFAGDPANLALAITRYEYNTQLSEAFYTPLQVFEITLRNRMHRAMAATYGSHWLQTGAAPLATDATTRVAEAISAIGARGKTITPGRIVAELSFSFWVSLAARRYDATLWRAALYRAFRKRLNRQIVHGRLNAIRRLRNRIAHHEPILHRDMSKAHNEIIQATSWMCQETSQWSQTMSRVPSILVRDIRF